MRYAMRKRGDISSPTRTKCLVLKKVYSLTVVFSDCPNLGLHFFSILSFFL
jgi:hypothetical protein